MNTDTILRLLTNSGFRVLGADSSYVYIEDPGCVLRSFETFVEYAWIIISAITALLLAGWAISMIRGAKNDIATNIRNLLIMFATLSAAVPIVNVIWGDDLFARGCNTVKVSVAEVNKILDARNLTLTTYSDDLYEELNIYDSGIRTPDSVTDDTTPTNNNPPADKPATTPSQSGGAAPVNAVGAAADVIYIQPDGNRIKRTGGSRAWRNTNPGNIRYSALAQRMGAIGQAGGFAVFPTEDIGMNAIKGLLRSKSYINLTVAGAINRYAPPFENNTAAYNKKIARLTGLDITRKISDLTDAELDKMADAIRQIEGWTPGRIIQA